MSAEPAEVASVASLRERHMYDEAEQAGRKLWAEELSDHDRAELAIQLALVYTDQALAATEEEQDALWAKADGACAALVDGYPENDRRRLVEVQRALVSLARGTHDRRMQRTEPAITHLRAAIRQLATIAEGIGRELVERRLRSAAKTGDEELNVAELESLESHVALHLAQAERQVGLCYAAGTADRDDSLLQATRRLTKLAQRSPADEIVWNARVELIACQRELGNPQTAQRLLDAWMRENPPADVVARFRADAEPRLPLEPSKNANSSMVETSPTPKSTAAHAGAAGLAEAAAARSAGSFMLAAEKYREFALASPDHDQAADAHRLSVLCTADLMRETPSADRARAVEVYETLLREHLQRWPSQPSADDVRMWLGRLLATRKDWPEVVSVVQQVRPTSTNYVASLQLIADAYDRQLQSLEQTNADVERARLLAAVTQHLQSVITGTENRWPKPWSELQHDVALQLSRLHVRYGEASSPYASRLLTAALRDEPKQDTQAEATWTSDARIWLAAALARNGDLANAQRLAEQSKDAPPETVLDTLQVVVEELPTVDAVTDATERQLGELALSMVRSVDSRSNTLDAASLTRLNVCRAAALAAVDDRNAALTQYGALVGESPKDADIQERYAELLAAADEPKELRQSLLIWQAVETRSRRGSNRWQRARRARIELLTRLGEAGEAEKLLNLTRLLDPNWEAASSTQQK